MSYPQPFAPGPVLVQQPIRPTSQTHMVIAWVLAVLTFGYLLPWAIAATRQHQNVVAIALINVLTGWTGIGFLSTLIWSCVGVQTRLVALPSAAPNQPLPPAPWAGNAPALPPAHSYPTYQQPAIEPTQILPPRY